ncbi:MAG: hypothetical protein Q9195_008534 [Heterodermia aff. obscurata]
MQLTILVSVLAIAATGSFAIPIAATERHAAVNELERGLSKPRSDIEEGLARPRSAFQVEDALAVTRNAATADVEDGLARPRDIEAGLAQRRAAASEMEVGLAEKREPEVEKGLAAKGSVEKGLIE